MRSRAFVLLVMCVGYFLVLLGDLLGPQTGRIDRFDRVWARVAGMWAGAVSGLLVVGRMVQGVGAVPLLPGTLAVITRAYPDSGAQARAIGVWAAVGALALLAGPLLGGLLVDTWGWRSVFLINVPIVALAVIVAARVVASSPPERTRLDLPGMAQDYQSCRSTAFMIMWVSGDFHSCGMRLG